MMVTTATIEVSANYLLCGIWYADGSAAGGGRSIGIDDDPNGWLIESIEFHEGNQLATIVMRRAE